MMDTNFSLRFVISDDNYSQLLTSAREAAGFSADAPLLPSFGITFYVRLDTADLLETPKLVPGVILAQSMATPPPAESNA